MYRANTWLSTYFEIEVIHNEVHYTFLLLYEQKLLNIYNIMALEDTCEIIYSR